MRSIAFNSKKVFIFKLLSPVSAESRNVSGRLKGGYQVKCCNVWLCEKQTSRKTGCPVQTEWWLICQLSPLFENHVIGLVGAGISSCTLHKIKCQRNCFKKVLSVKERLMLTVYCSLFFFNHTPSWKYGSTVMREFDLRLTLGVEWNGKSPTLTRCYGLIYFMQYGVSQWCNVRNGMNVSFIETKTYHTTSTFHCKYKFHS